MNPKKRNDITAILTGIRWILPLALWVSLCIFSRDFLSKVEERSFFQYDLFWLNGFLKTPSGLLSYCGAFFTQFLHIPWLGAMIWVLLLTASAELTRTVFRIPAGISLITYIPAAIFAAYNMTMGYMVYILNLPGYFFIPVLGYLWALLTVSVLRKASKPFTAILLYLLMGLAGYYIAGVFAIAGIITAVADCIVSDRGRRISIPSAVCALAVVIMAPILFLGTSSYNLSAGWTLGMPDHIFAMSRSRMQTPLIIALVWLLIMPFIHRLKNLFSARRVVITTQVLALSLTVALPAAFWYRDDNFRTELRMIHATDNFEWENVIGIYERIQDRHETDPSWQPTRIMVLLKDMALLKTGKDNDRTFDFDDGSQEQNRKFNLPMSLQIGKTYFFNYGIPGVCNRWCIEEAILSGYNNMTYKYMAMNAMLQDKTELALKYLGALEHTLFYRKWARQQRRLCTETSLIATSVPYDKILPLMCYEDIVRSDFDGCEYFMTEHFNGSSPQNTTPLYDRAALLFAMKSKQPTLFWARFFLYLDSNNPDRIGRSYQEAAYLFSIIGRNQTLLRTLPIDDQVKELYNSFSQIASKVGNISDLEARSAFPPHLRHTYFYYYYYVNKLQLF